MDSRRRSLFPMSARKSAPVRAGGVNARRLALAQAMREEKKPPEVEEDEEEEEKARSNQCGNPFCETILTNRYARFCEDKAMCQCYRALKLQCLANAQAKEDEEDTRPLALVIKKKKKEKGQERESFAIPRKKVEKRRLEVDVSEEKRSSSSSPRQKEKVVKKHKKKEEEKKKKEKRARDTVGNGESSSAAAGPPATSAAEFISQLDKMKKRVKDPRARQPPEMSSDLENGASWTKKRRLSRRVSADDAQSKSASSSPVRAPASDANWTIPRAKPVRAKTAAQAIRRSMNVEPVPLGVANQANFTGGGRNNGSYDYGADTHFSPESSPAEQPYWREISREKPPPPQRAPSPRRNEVERVNIDQRKSDYPDPDEDTPTFSYHESFLPRLLSIFIRKLPQSLEAVFNVTKKPRKMNWYIKYVERIERLCQPCDLRVTFDGLKAVVTVHDREWLTLQGQSTLTLHKDVIKSLRAEAMTWLQFHEEAKNALAHYRSIYGSDANESYTFLRAWNELKTQGNNISLSRQANYFCGARLHHWNFVVGKVEIGSGSHEEKREAFRLATVSALDFLLSIGEGERRPGVNVKRERFSEGDRLSTRGGRRSSSRDSSANRVRLSPANDQADGASGEVSSSAGATSSGGPLSSAGQPTAIEPAPPTDPRSSTSEPQSSAEPSSSPVPVDRTETLAVAVIPTTDSNSSKEATEAADQSDPGEEMSISDANEAGSPRSTGVPPTTSPVSAGASAASTASASNATTLFTEEPSLGKAPSKPATTAVASALPSATAGDSATTKHTHPTPKAAVPPRRCMMCEMIRMRKPDGERCLRCQQKGAPVLGTS
ncbi:hypothetical protein KRP22_004066 [Phytophthora ramorum]|nr:hypothetical protein KRP22_9999 [Phytophthora ramorum]